MCSTGNPWTVSRLSKVPQTAKAGMLARAADGTLGTFTGGLGLVQDRMTLTRTPGAPDR